MQRGHSLVLLGVALALIVAAGATWLLGGPYDSLPVSSTGSAAAPPLPSTGKAMDNDEPWPARLEVSGAAAPAAGDDPPNQTLPAPSDQTATAAKPSVVRRADVSQALLRARRLAADRGIPLPQQDELDFASRQAVLAAYDALMADYDRIGKRRQPIVDEVVDRKVALGRVEPTRSNRAPRELSRAEARAWQAAARADREPTRPGQIVVSRGAADFTQLIRVDLDDDARLPPLARELTSSESNFLEHVLAALHNNH